jgi:exonuclease 3'-5' domain-containing protein 1
VFNTSDVKQETLKDILQDEKIPKVFFNSQRFRCLICTFQRGIAGSGGCPAYGECHSEDYGIEEVLERLGQCVEKNVLLDGSDLASWKKVKEKGERLFTAEHGGSYEAINQRLILEDIISCCVGDVQYLAVHEARLSASDRVVAPWNEDQNMTLDQWNHMPPQDYFDGAFDSNGDWTKAAWQGPLS